MLITDYDLIRTIKQRRQRWSDALLRGGYKQGKVNLKSKMGRIDGSEEYCCLGVACELFGADVGVFPNREHYIDSRRRPITFFSPSTSSAMTFMPRELRIHLGLSHQSELLLAKLNDQQVPFTVIAGTLQWLPVEDGFK